MNILVCISRVPDTASRIMVSADGKTVDKQGIKYIVNPYDEFALEEGLRLREKNGGTVTALAVGPDGAKDILRTALAMGVDKAVLVKADENIDSFAVAENLANYAKETNPAAGLTEYPYAEAVEGARAYFGGDDLAATV